jgi:hypothetical protein
MTENPFSRIPSPQLQIRSLCLQDALSNTVKTMDIIEIDNELATYTPKESLAMLAAHGLRGELLFPVPCILALNPRLLGYYRLLLGYSRKEFYRSKYGTSAFAGMEDNSTLSPRGGELLPQLCQVLIAHACDLLQGLGSQGVSGDLQHRAASCC